MVQTARAAVFAFLLASLASPGAGFDGKAASPEQVTMDRMRAIAGALLSRQSDETSGENRLGPSSDDFVLASQPSALVRMPARKELRPYREVVELLQPFENLIYLQDIPEHDAWGERIEVYYEQEKLLTGRVVTVRSSGANRRFDADAYEIGAFLLGSATDDIVISGERFVRWPIGVPEAELDVQAKP